MSTVLSPVGPPQPTRLGLLLAGTALLGGFAGVCLAFVALWPFLEYPTDGFGQLLSLVEAVPAWLATTSAGWYLLRFRPSRTVGLFLTATGVVMGTWFLTIGFSSWWYYSCSACEGSDLLSDVSYAITETLQFSFIGMVLFILPHLYPNGVLAGRLWRNVFRAAVAAFVTASAFWLTVGAGVLHIGPDGYMEVGNTVVRNWNGAPIGDDSSYWLVLEGTFLTSILFMFASASAVMVRRWRRSSGMVRRQLGVFSIAEVVTVVLLLILGLLPEVRDLESASGRVLSTVLSLVQAGGPVLVVLAIAIAVLRYNLYDVRVVIRRVVIYATLTVGLTVVFVAVYSAVNWLARGLTTPATPWVAALAGVVVVLSVEPGRRRLQRRLERRFFGDRGEPLRAIARLRERVVRGDEKAVQQGLVETVAAAVRSPSVQLGLQRGPQLEMVASTGPPDAAAIVVPLLHRGERLGEFRVSARTLGESYGRTDLVLLEQLADQAGAHIYGLRRDAELSTVRQQALTATIVERARLGRDLHDGLAPLIAGAGLSAEALRRRMIPGSPDEQNAAVLASRLRGAAGELRRISHDLQPGPLALRGLAGAIQDYITSLTGPDLPRFDVRVSAERLPPAVELVIYRVVLEAVANVVRHARAGRSTVAVDMRDHEVDIEVRDDGTGLQHPYISGVGIASMRSRIEALGGELTLRPLAGGGTMLHARLPLGAG